MAQTGVLLDRDCCSLRPHAPSNRLDLGMPTRMALSRDVVFWYVEVALLGILEPESCFRVVALYIYWI